MHVWMIEYYDTSNHCWLPTFSIYDTRAEARYQCQNRKDYGSNVRVKKYVRTD